MSTPPASPAEDAALGLDRRRRPSRTTQRVALPQASTSPPSAFQIRILHVGDVGRLEQDHLVAADAGAPVGDRPRPRRVHRHRALARVEDDEIVAEAVHLVEAGHVEQAI